MVDLRPCGYSSRCRLELRSVVGLHLAPQMMVLVLIRGALKGLGSAHKCALSQVRARLEVGEAEPATASIVVFTGLPSKSGAGMRPTLAMTSTLPAATINAKLTDNGDPELGPANFCCHCAARPYRRQPVAYTGSSTQNQVLR